MTNLADGLAEKFEGMKSKVMVRPPPEKKRYEYSEAAIKFLVSISKTSKSPVWKQYAVYEKEDNMRTPADRKLIKQLETKDNYENAIYFYNRHLETRNEENRMDIYDPATKETITIGKFREKYGEVGEQFVREFLDNGGNTSQETWLAMKRYISAGITPTMGTNTTTPVGYQDIDAKIEAAVQKAQVATKPEDYVDPVPDSLTGQAVIDSAAHLKNMEDKENSLFNPPDKKNQRKGGLGYYSIENKTMDSKKFREDTTAGKGLLAMYMYMRTYIKWKPTANDKYRMYQRYTKKGFLAVSISKNRLAEEFNVDWKTAHHNVEKMLKFGWIKLTEFGLNVGNYKDQNIYLLGYLVDKDIKKQRYYIDEVYPDEE